MPDRDRSQERLNGQIGWPGWQDWVAGLALVILLGSCFCSGYLF